MVRKDWMNMYLGSYYKVGILLCLDYVYIEFYTGTVDNKQKNYFFIFN